MRKHLRLFLIVLKTRRWVTEISENFEAKLTLLLNTAVLEKLIETTSP